MIGLKLAVKVAIANVTDNRTQYASFRNVIFGFLDNVGESADRDGLHTGQPRAGRLVPSGSTYHIGRPNTIGRVSSDSHDTPQRFLTCTPQLGGFVSGSGKLKLLVLGAFG